MTDDDTRELPAAEPHDEPGGAKPPAGPRADRPGPAASSGRPLGGAPTPTSSYAARERAGVRVGTVVWGLVVVALGVGLLAIAWGAHLDAELAFIVLLAAAGVALLVGSLVGMRRSRNRTEGRG